MARGLSYGLLRLCNGVWKDLGSDAVDIVEVVRCKDCKYYHDFETHFDCNNTCGLDYVRPTDFCSYGERKDND